MFKLKINSLFTESELKHWINQAKDERLYGCIFETFDDLLLLRRASHKITDILCIGEEYYGLIEILDTQYGNILKVLLNTFEVEQFKLVSCQNSLNVVTPINI